MFATGLKKRLYEAAALLILAIMLPGVASAVPTNAYTINVNGNLDTAFRLFGGTSPFSVGDPVAGSFDLTVGPDNTFDVGNTVTNPVGSLSNFHVTVGPATFNLGTSNFVEFRGQLSADGSQVTQLAFDSYPMDVGLDVPYGLQIQAGTPNLLYVTNSGIVHAPITTTVTAQATAVPEPGSLAMLSVGLLLLGAGAYAARRRAS